MKKIYKGYLKLDSYGEGDDILFLMSDDSPLAEQIQEDIEEFGNFLSVRYFVSDLEKSIDQLKESLITSLLGIGEGLYQDAYSECTGYLWTDEEIKIGGHDLLNELKNCVGKYIYLEISYYKKPAT